MVIGRLDNCQGVGGGGLLEPPWTPERRLLKRGLFCQGLLAISRQKTIKIGIFIKRGQAMASLAPHNVLIQQNVIFMFLVFFFFWSLITPTQSVGVELA